MRTSLAVAAALVTVLFFTACPVKKPDLGSPAEAIYTITYHQGNADAGTAPAPQTKKKGQTIALSGNSGGFSLTGMSMVCWNTQADGHGSDYLFGSSYSADADLDLYAKFLAPPSLASIAPSDGAFDRTFDPAITDYAVVLADNVTSFSLNAALPTDSLYSLSYSAPQPMSLALGSNPLTVTVSLPGSADRVYHFDLRREGRFVTEWAIPSAGTSVTLPLVTTNGSTFNCIVDWGDGTAPTTITTADYATTRNHTYAAAGTYWVSILGTCEGWDFETVMVSRYLMRRTLSWGDVSFFPGFKRFGFYGCVNLVSVATGGIKDGGLTSLADCFTGCSGLTSLPGDLFRYDASVTSFNTAFWSCMGLTTLPADLFRFNPAVTDFAYAFFNCSKLEALPADLFRSTTKVTNFDYTFRECSSLSSLPADLFRYNTEASTFAGVFYLCSGIKSLPGDLFRYNTAAANFSGSFYSCTNLSALPADLFRYNTSATKFGSAFSGCTSLTSLPADLFRYNTAAVDFSYTFFGCTSLALNSTLFYPQGAEAMRFAGQAVDFSYCFRRTRYSGLQGTAPNLWACTYGSVTSSGCLYGAGNSSASLSNYADIPTAWK